MSISWCDLKPGNQNNQQNKRMVSLSLPIPRIYSVHLGSPFCRRNSIWIIKDVNLNGHSKVASSKSLHWTFALQLCHTRLICAYCGCLGLINKLVGKVFQYDSRECNCLSFVISKGVESSEEETKRRKVFPRRRLVQHATFRPKWQRSSRSTHQLHAALSADHFHFL